MPLADLTLDGIESKRPQNLVRFPCHISVRRSNVDPFGSLPQDRRRRGERFRWNVRFDKNVHLAGCEPGSELRCNSDTCSRLEQAKLLLRCATREIITRGHRSPAGERQQV